MVVKLASALPKDWDANGMELMHRELVAHPDRRHLVVMVVDCLRTNVEHMGGEDRHTPTAGVLFIEPIGDGDDVERVMDVMARARTARTGEATLFDYGVGDDPLAKAAFDLRTASGVFVGTDGKDDE